MLDPQKAKDLENGVNQGVVEPTEEELNKVGEDVSGAVLAPDSNWDKFLSDLDPQSSFGFDTNGCNIFSSAHCIESLINALGGDPNYSENGLTEFSERHLCVACGLDGNSGSSEAQYEQGLRAAGVIKHSLLPFTPGMSKAEFFTPLTPEIKAEAKKFLDRYDITFRRVGTDKASLIEALKYAPVKIFIGTGGYFNMGEPNVIPRTENPMNHAVMVRRVDDQGIHIYDQYSPFLKVLAPNYQIFYAFQTLLNPKGNQMNPNIEIFKNGVEYIVGVKMTSEQGLAQKLVETGCYDLIGSDGKPDFSKIDKIAHVL
jgi:hypothetical protein